MRGAARRCSTSCGAPTWGERLPPVEETWDSEVEGDGAVGTGPEAGGGRGLAE